MREARKRDTAGPEARQAAAMQVRNTEGRTVVAKRQKAGKEKQVRFKEPARKELSQAEPSN